MNNDETNELRDPRESESSQNAELDRLIASYLEQVERGEQPSLNQIIADHPQFAEQLKAFFANEEKLAGAIEQGMQTTTVDLPPTPAVGSPRIGNYKLLQLLGSGGMGEVWMAEQERPVKRRVALKLIKPGMDSRAVLARFEAERQALALMNHPNIAKVFDAGVVSPTDQAVGAGRPYFVMELVKGIPITEYCNLRRLEIKQRLELFRQCCSAVQHAHQKGIIHRDLKPSNLLIENHDDKPVLKVIDFGLAKAMGGTQLTEQTLFTALGTVAGTPLYMAPEQAIVNALDIDTRVDIYSLGVLLYELLTGSTPLTRETVKEKAIDELLKLIREYDPPTPSHRLSTSEALPSIAAERQVEPQRLGRFVRGELDWIVMKALEKDRERRYGTATAFGQDIERFLNDEPVYASPPSRVYRVRKFVHKNRGKVFAATALLFTLLVAIVGTSWGLFRAKTAEGKAKTAENKALSALSQVTEERDAKNEALLAVEQQKRESDRQREVAETNLLAGILRPIGQGESEYLSSSYIWRYQIGRAELKSLAEWSDLSDSRLKLFALESAINDPTLALQVATKSERVIQACVGLSTTRRSEAIDIATKTQTNPNADPRCRIAACMFAMELGSPDLPAFVESAEYFAKRIKTRKPNNAPEPNAEFVLFVQSASKRVEHLTASQRFEFWKVLIGTLLDYFVSSSTFIEFASATRSMETGRTASTINAPTESGEMGVFGNFADVKAAFGIANIRASCAFSLVTYAPRKVGAGPFCRPNQTGGSRNGPGTHVLISRVVRVITDPRSLASLLQHPGCVGIPREMMLMRFEELVLHDGKRMFELEKPWVSRIRSESDELRRPQRQFLGMYDAANWIKKNWPDFDLEATHPVRWRGK